VLPLKLHARGHNGSSGLRDDREQKPCMGAAGIFFPFYRKLMLDCAP